MNASQRREEIIKALHSTCQPIPAKVFASRYEVSRQVIVSDISIIRASGVPVVSYNKGYMIEYRQTHSKVFKVLHSDEDVEKELSLIVESGGVIEDVFVFHRVYGKLSAPMNIKNKKQIQQFLQEISSGKSSLLKNVTAGYHYHTVSADSPETLSKIEQILKENGFLAPLKPYEPIGIGEGRY